MNIKEHCRRLHQTYAINWTTTTLTLGIALLIQLMGIAVKHEYRTGMLSEAAAADLNGMLLASQAVLLLFWLTLCYKSYRGPTKWELNQWYNQ